MKKQFLLTLLMAVLCSMSAWAEEGTLTKFLTIEHKDGSETHFALMQNPLVQFGDDNITVSCMGDTQIPRSEVSRFYFSDRSFGSIDDVKGGDTFVQYLDNNHLVISANGLKEATAYGMNGVAAATAKAADGTVTLDLSNAPAGVYVVSLPGLESIKFIKK